MFDTDGAGTSVVFHHGWRRRTVAGLGTPLYATCRQGDAGEQQRPLYEQGKHSIFHGMTSCPTASFN